MNILELSLDLVFGRFGEWVKFGQQVFASPCQSCVNDLADRL